MLPWPRSTTYGQIAKMYADHVRNKYNTDATVVFDGHDEGPST